PGLREGARSKEKTTVRRLDRERRAAAARGGGVRVLDDELGAFQTFLVVDFRAHQVLVAHGVDQQLYAVLLQLGVVLVHFFVEGEPVLEAGTAAALYENAQLERWIALLVD